MVILITGITSGFGRAMARKLAHDGHIVYGTHRKESDRIPGVTYLKADPLIRMKRSSRAQYRVIGAAIRPPSHKTSHKKPQKTATEHFAVPWLVCFMLFFFSCFALRLCLTAGIR